MRERGFTPLFTLETIATQDWRMLSAAVRRHHPVHIFPHSSHIRLTNTRGRKYSRVPFSSLSSAAAHSRSSPTASPYRMCSSPLFSPPTARPHISRYAAKSMCTVAAPCPPSSAPAPSSSFLGQQGTQRCISGISNTDSPTSPSSTRSRTAVPPPPPLHPGLSRHQHQPRLCGAVPITTVTCAQPTQERLEEGVNRWQGAVCPTPRPSTRPPRARVCLTDGTPHPSTKAFPPPRPSSSYGAAGTALVVIILKSTGHLARWEAGARPPDMQSPPHQFHGAGRDDEQRTPAAVSADHSPSLANRVQRVPSHSSAPSSAPSASSVIPPSPLTPHPPREPHSTTNAYSPAAPSTAYVRQARMYFIRLRRRKEHQNERQISGIGMREQIEEELAVVAM
ncbi:hypothetical protein R3P38DRAFT_3227253 [Favolaschia claudopus]|uniref:Uncharacterized protein n=1 Tax=Favolaschia claudopus TaxID=2862362 RepID=A0AAV9ZSV3_9AGAR